MDALSLLKEDHDKVKKMLEELESTTERGVKTREELFTKLTHELTVHEEIEEEIFYPALKEHPKTKEITLEAYEEHHVVDTIMADAGYAITGGSLILIGMGLLHLGITSYILRVVIGLMTVLSGFEILYSAVEGSILVAALLATINLGLALVGAYLMIAQYNAREAEAQA